MIHDALSSNKLGISNPSQVGVDIKMTLPLLVAALCFNGAGIGGQQVRKMLPILLSKQIIGIFIGSKGSFQKRVSGFCPLRGYPPTPLTDNHFAKKPLADRGGYPPT